MSWCSHSAHNCSRNIECRKIQRRYYCPIVLSFLQQRNFDHIFQHDNARCHVALVCQDFLNQNHICVLPWPALSLDLSPIEHLWDELCSTVDVFATVKIHRKHYRSCVTHLCTSVTTSHTPLSNDWLVMRQRCEAVVAARGGHTRYWTPKTSILHDNFYLSMICSDNDVEKFWWYYLICYAHTEQIYHVWERYFSQIPLPIWYTFVSV
jgi:hypothetical protein